MFAAATFEEISRLERELDPQLQDRRQNRRIDFAYVATARRWSKAVWQVAKAHGPAPLSSDDLANGSAFASAPVFICGMHRSGTTWLRDLLDGHPSLVVLPSEARFYGNLERRMGALPWARRPEFLCRIWLEGLVNPMNQPPYWTLGRSGPVGSPYVEFARRFSAWWAFLESRTSGPTSSWPLVCHALAYAGQRLGQAAEAPLRWVEKTPLTERHTERIWADFSAAKVLQIIRRPDAVISSYKALLKDAGAPTRAIFPAVWKLAYSYRIAAELSRRASPERYRLVRYEELVARREEVVEDLARFLGIEPSDVLCDPTVAGAPATSNSSFHGERERSSRGLTRAEGELLSVLAGPSANALGYGGLEPASGVGRAVAHLQRLWSGPGVALAPTSET